MTEKQIRQLSKAELLELLITSRRENESLRRELAEKEELLHKREIIIENAGSLAEACLSVNRVIEAAQSAADQYLENVKRMADEQSRVIKENYRDAQAQANALLTETARKCAAMEARAEKEVEEKWKQIKTRLEEFYDAHLGLRELINSSKSIF